MKKINIIIIAFVALTMVFSSCFKEETPLYGDPSNDADAYVQLFFGEELLTINKLDATGNASDVSYEIQVRLLGAPPTSDVEVPFTVSTDLPDGMVAATNAMYTLSGSSFVVKAGSAYGAVTITLHNAELPLQDSVSFKVSLAEGGPFKLASTSTEAYIHLFKKDFCPYSLDDFVGTWDVVEEGYYMNINETYNVTKKDDNTLTFTNSFWYAGPTSIWGETIIDVGDPLDVVFDLTDPVSPIIDFVAPQYLETSLDPNGVDEYEYWIASWNQYDQVSDNPWVLDYCNKTLTIYYYIPYGAADGGLVDIVSLVLDYSGGKKVVYVNHINPVQHKIDLTLKKH